MTADIIRKGRSRPFFSLREHRLLSVGAVLTALAVLIPLLALITLALSGGGADWPHLARNVLPVALKTTALVMAGVALLTASMGIIPAWLTAYYEFPGRRVLAWALVLPLAVPTYLAAYAYAEFFTFTGPPQSLIRALFGFKTSRDYWFPDIRSLWGAVVILSFVLYPYVYLTTRAAFLMQGRNATDVARTLGSSPTRAFFRVLLPMARPAIIVGVTLALMETLNDVGAVEFLGVKTLTSAVYTTWLNQGSLNGAAQIACIMLVVVLGVILAERWARRRQRFNLGRSTSMVRRSSLQKLSGWQGGLAFIACLMPIIAGFGLPVYVLGAYAVKRLDQLLDPTLQEAILTSVLVAAAAAVVTVGLAFLLTYTVRVTRSRNMLLLNRFAALGYAIPGTVLALGILIPLARFDNLLDHWMQATFGIKTGLLLTGTALCIIYAMSVRFLAMAEGAIEAGFHKVPIHIDMAARTLGRSPRETLTQVLIPILKPAFLTAGLLVFIDSIKELSATILLRPFNYNSLSTYVYERASRAAVEDASVAALLIMLAGILPVILLSRSINAGVARTET
ncbi:iron ABC transporter permease [Nordella sp. HKS 07]|uniref:ABC transporter permease n=1 Tax=Nordella sp. HKS 07 TaxID=2712222 RepID=UPI0013E18B80|nr:iron ABC transporter permease [Nordella sp. HKS 07]QIG50848.1 iron ABC transporter permease [Nordella sp. HKS 07]